MIITFLCFTHKPILSFKVVDSENQMSNRVVRFRFCVVHNDQPDMVCKDATSTGRTKRFSIGVHQKDIC